MSTSTAALPGEIPVGAPGYDEARTAVNLAVEQRPASIVPVSTTDEIVAALAAATRRRQQVAVQGTTHGAGSLGPAQGALILRIGGLDFVSVDPEAQTVTFGGGAQAGPIAAAAAEHGLTLPGGFSRTVGLTGYALSGGIGWLARRAGFASQSIVAAEIVLADGGVVQVDEASDPELLWALRGGGGSFGVVTSLTLKAQALDSIHGGSLYWPVEAAPEVFTAWLKFTETAPDDVTSVAKILALPPIPEIPEPLRGQTWAVIQSVHATDGAEHERLLEPLRALGPVIDDFKPLTGPDLGVLHGDPEQPMPAIGDHLLLNGLDDEAVAALISAAGAGSDSALVAVEWRHCGGALARGNAGDGPLGALDADFVLHAIGVAAGPDLAAATTASLEHVTTALQPWSTGRSLTTLCEHPTPTDQVYGPAALERLRAVAARVDPDGLFLSNFPLR